MSIVSFYVGKVQKQETPPQRVSCTRYPLLHSMYILILQTLLYAFIISVSPLTWRLVRRSASLSGSVDLFAVYGIDISV